MVASSSNTSTTRHGEVIETSTTRVLAESDRLHILPELGSLVRIDSMTGQPTIYGVVSYGATSGLDPSRRAVRRGDHALNDHAVYRRHPELEMVLRTTFEVAIVGFADGDRCCHFLPTLPAPLHFSVRACTDDETSRFCAEPRYLSSLLTYRGELSPEQLVASHLRWVDSSLDDGHAWLANATRRLARLMQRDYDQLALLLHAVEPRD